MLAHGKLVHEDVLPHLKEGGLFTKYIMGELHADFLDADDPRRSSCRMCMSLSSSLANTNIR